MKIFYVFIDYRKFELCEEPLDPSPRQGYFLHIEGKDFTIGWNEQGEIFLTKRPVVLQGLKEIAASQEILTGPPIEAQKIIDMADADALAIIEATTDHPLYQFAMEIYEILKQIAESKKALKPKHQQLVDLIKSLPQSIGVGQIGSS